MTEIVHSMIADRLRMPEHVFHYLAGLTTTNVSQSSDRNTLLCQIKMVVIHYMMWLLVVEKIVWLLTYYVRCMVRHFLSE